jgi:hypothetical protein
MSRLCRCGFKGLGSSLYISHTLLLFFYFFSFFYFFFSFCFLLSLSLPLSLSDAGAKGVSACFDLRYLSLSFRREIPGVRRAVCLFVCMRARVFVRPEPNECLRPNRYRKASFSAMTAIRRFTKQWHETTRHNCLANVAGFSPSLPPSSSLPSFVPYGTLCLSLPPSLLLRPSLPSPPLPSPSLQDSLPFSIAHITMHACTHARTTDRYRFIVAVRWATLSDKINRHHDKLDLAAAAKRKRVKLPANARQNTGPESESGDVPDQALTEFRNRWTKNMSAAKQKLKVGSACGWGQRLSWVSLRH